MVFFSKLILMSFGRSNVGPDVRVFDLYVQIGFVQTSDTAHTEVYYAFKTRGSRQNKLEDPDKINQIARQVPVVSS